MQVWMDDIAHEPRGGAAPIAGPNNVIVLHSTETGVPASYSGTNPHFEVCDPAVGQSRQFIALDEGALALYNAPGGVETNRRAGHIWQIEIVGYAAKMADVSDGTLAELARVVRFIRSQGEVPLVIPPQGLWMPGTIATADSPLRFTFEEWNRYAGFCGHSNVPENDHWDPGMFPWDRFLTILGESPDQGVLMAVTEADFKALAADVAATYAWVRGVRSELDDVKGKVDTLFQRMIDEKNGAVDPDEAVVLGLLKELVARGATPPTGASASDIATAVWAELQRKLAGS